MFCTDDKHPNDLLEKGHIDYIVKKAISLGADPITAVKVACHNAARYFLLNNRGGISPGYLADFVIIDNFQNFNIEQVYKKGVLMVDHGEIQDFPIPGDRAVSGGAGSQDLPCGGPHRRGLRREASPGHHRYGGRRDHHGGRRVLRPYRCGI